MEKLAKFLSVFLTISGICISAIAGILTMYYFGYTQNWGLLAIVPAGFLVYAMISVFELVISAFFMIAASASDKPSPSNTFWMEAVEHSSDISGESYEAWLG